MRKYFDEIADYRNDASIRATLRILNILESNRQRLLSKMDPEIYNSLIKSYTALADTTPSLYTSNQFKDEFNRLFMTLNYHLEKIIW